MPRPESRIPFCCGSICFLTILGVGCAGPKYHINDVVLSDVPVQDKERMLAVQGEINQAAEEKNKAQADVAMDDRDISVAEAESSQSRLESGKLEAELRLAERGQDLNRILPAKANFTAVNSAKNTSEAKLTLARAAPRLPPYADRGRQLHGTAAERRYELEKARLAQSTGKLPSKNFDVAQFEGQAAQSQQKYDQARVHADKQQMEPASSNWPTISLPRPGRCPSRFVSQREGERRVDSSAGHPRALR